MVLTLEYRVKMQTQILYTSLQINVFRYLLNLKLMSSMNLYSNKLRLRKLVRIEKHPTSIFYTESQEYIAPGRMQV